MQFKDWIEFGVFCVAVLAIPYEIIIFKSSLVSFAAWYGDITIGNSVSWWLSTILIIILNTFAIMLLTIPDQIFEARESK